MENDEKTINYFDCDRVSGDELTHVHVKKRKIIVNYKISATLFALLID
jgi:hypothetical protein